MSGSPTYRDHSLDLARVAGAAAVIGIHALGGGVAALHGGRQWEAAVLLSAVSWAVPVFAMVSGALVLAPYEPERWSWRRKLGRLGVPLAIWTLLYGLAGRIHGGPAFMAVFWRNLALGRPWPEHLHYLVAALGLYALTPLLAAMRGGLTPRGRRAAAFSCLLLIGADAALRLSLGWPRMSGSALMHWWGLLGYYLAGAELAEWRPSWRRPAAICLFGVGLLAAILVWAPPLAPLAVIPVSLAAFGLCRACGGCVPDWVRAAAPYTYGVYLIHLTPLLLGRWLRLLPEHADAAAVMPMILGLYGLSLLLAAIMARLPLAWRLVGFAAPRAAGRHGFASSIVATRRP